MPTKLLELELSEPLAPIRTCDSHPSYRILVRQNTKPIGWLSFWNVNEKEQISIDDLNLAIKTQLPKEALYWALPEQLSFQTTKKENPEAISVVICTRNRTATLATCLRSLLQLDYPSFEIIVVDNAPSNDETKDLVATLPVRYVREDRPGLDWARNRGIREAGNPIIAFTDDDVIVDKYWLQNIDSAFSSEDIKCVTGFVAPAELETNAQHLFELGYGGMGHGFRKKIIRNDEITENQLIWASGFGVGANMAYRREVFSVIGEFDTALDVGTPSTGGGDVEMFHRVVSRGQTLVYDPAVLVWHTHRRTINALRKQIMDNGRGFGCYLFTGIRNKTISKTGALKFLAVDWFKNWILRNFLKPKKHLPRNIAAIEFLGMMKSPFAYLSSRRRSKEIAGRQSNDRINQQMLHV